MNRINVCLNLTGFMVWGPARAAGAKSEGQGRGFCWSIYIIIIINYFTFILISSCVWGA